MKLRNLIALCLALLLLTACGQPAGPQRFDTTFLDLFDTVTTVVGLFLASLFCSISLCVFCAKYHAVLITIDL